MKYSEMTAEELKTEFQKVKSEYDVLCSYGLSLNMARGKPGSENLDLSNKLLDALNSETNFTYDSIDCRNYGGMTGLSGIKNIFSEMLGVNNDCIIVGGNSSLSMMFDTVAQGMSTGLGGEPWSTVKERKFLCPCPGYDRHFAITEHFGFQLINIRMTESGPDMDEIEKYVNDETVKGIWCVPKYANPTGITYSDETVKRLAALKPAAKDFHIFWDNAYAVHDLYDEGDCLLNLMEECKKNGNENLPIMFASTSKITFPGSGVAVEAGSPETVALLESRIKYQSIGPDKINQLRHLKTFPDFASVKEQMKKHAEILRPKFEAVVAEFDKSLSDKGIAKWTNPRGGYFISLDVMPGCAKRVEELCKGAGLTLTPAGATYPYGIDPENKNLRIAPSYPKPDEIKLAAKVLAVAVKYATLENKVKLS